MVVVQGVKLSVQFSSVAQSCLTLCDPMNHSTPGLPVHHHQEYMQLLVLRGSKHLKNQSLQVALSLREEGVPPSPITAVQADIWNTRSWTLGRRKVMANQVGLRSGLQSPRGKKQEKLGRRGRSTKENSVRCLDCLQRIWCWMLRWVLGKGEAKCISRTHQKLISKPSSLMNKS